MYRKKKCIQLWWRALHFKKQLKYISRRKKSSKLSNVQLFSRAHTAQDQSLDARYGWADSWFLLLLFCSSRLNPAILCSPSMKTLLRMISAKKGLQLGDLPLKPPSWIHRDSPSRNFEVLCQGRKGAPYQRLNCHGGRKPGIFSKATGECYALDTPHPLPLMKPHRGSWKLLFPYLFYCSLAKLDKLWLILSMVCLKCTHFKSWVMKQDCLNKPQWRVTTVEGSGGMRNYG